MNKAILMGRLTRDPEVRYTQGEHSMAIARYTLAIDRRTRREQEQTADFINIVAFDRAGEFVEKYFHQGMRVLVSGRIQTGSYVNRDGQKIYTMDVIAEEQEFADAKRDNGGNLTIPQKSDSLGDGFMNIPDGFDESGLPFN